MFQQRYDIDSIQLRNGNLINDQQSILTKWPISVRLKM